MLVFIIPCLLVSSAHAQSCGAQRQVTFAASLSSPVVAEGDGVIRYDNVQADSDPAYDASTGVFTCPTPGLYFFNLTGSCENQPDRTFNLAILKNGSIHQESGWGHAEWIDGLTDGHRDDMSILHWLDVGDKVYVRSYNSYLDAGDGNTFSGFRLPVTSDPVKFAAQLSSPITADYGEVIRYDDVTVDGDAAYDQSTGVFTCQTQGLYFFNVTGTSHKQAEPFFSLSIHKNGAEQLDRIDAGPEGEDRSGTGHILRWMNVGDRVWVASKHSLSSLDAGAGSTFSGFRLAIKASRPVTFAASISSRLVAEREEKKKNRGPYDLVDPSPTILYDDVQEDTDSAINGTTGVLTCRTQGLYFVHVNVLCGKWRPLFRLGIYKNGKYQGNTSMWVCGGSSIHGRDSKGEMSVILWLNEGDQVLTETDRRDGYPGEGSSFSGFRLPMADDDC